MSRYLRVDLSRYFNNCGISYVNTIHSADFTGIGSSYPAEQLPESNSIVMVGDVPFSFPAKESGEMNNIEFNRQVISFQTGKYDQVFVLGTADNGSYNEILEIGNGRESVKIKLGLTDWINETAEFNETIAFHCYGCHSSKAGIISSFEPKIWFQSIDLPKRQVYNEIRLPDNPGMHIFALTFMKEGENA